MSEKNVKFGCSGIFILADKNRPENCSWDCPFNHTSFRASALGKCGMFGDCSIVSTGGALTAMARSKHCKEMFGRRLNTWKLGE